MSEMSRKVQGETSKFIHMKISLESSVHVSLDIGGDSYHA